MNSTARFERFEKWFKADGHWIYQSRAEAFDQWATNGIEGLPDAPDFVKFAIENARAEFYKS